METQFLRLTADRMNYSNDGKVSKIELPVLRAFTVAHFEIRLRGNSNEGFAFFEDPHIIWNDPPEKPSDQDEILLTIHHHGIRDYMELFYWIQNRKLVDRLADYYQEAEAAFQSGSWLSYALMCGGVFEGVLLEKVGASKRNNFYDLIEKAKEERFITDWQKELFHKAREARNLIHANLYEKEIVDRKTAMDLKVALSTLLVM